jgi:uncharacterized protein YbjT (DUF2867 family)
VRGTARSQSKAADWESWHPSTKGKIEWSIVEDIGAPNAFNEAVKGVDYIAHTASWVLQVTRILSGSPC